MNIFKTVLISILLSGCVFAQEKISFLVPDGWMLKNRDNYLLFTPKFQSIKSPKEVLEISLVSPSDTASQLLQKQVDNFKIYFSDFVAYSVDTNSTMVLGCSQKGGFCKVIRAINGENNLILMTYTNFQPHYSQGFFPKWTNILSHIVSVNNSPEIVYGEIFEL